MPRPERAGARVERVGPVEPVEPVERRVALVTLAVGVVVLVVLGVLLVPWDAVPGGPVEPVPAHELFTDAQLARAEAYSRWARVWSWSSLGVSLAVACWLGLSARGRRLVGRATSRVSGPWWLQAVAAVVVLTVVGRLLTLPFAVGLQRLRLDRGLTGQAWRSSSPRSGSSS